MYTHNCSPNKVGIIGAALLAGFHFIWVLLVAFEIAKPLMDWVLSLHMLRFDYDVAPFNIVSALSLLVFTGLVGYGIGYILGMIFPHCRDCSNGSCCYEGETKIAHQEHMMGTRMNTPKKKAKKKTVKKVAPKAKAKTKKKRK